MLCWQSASWCALLWGFCCLMWSIFGKFGWFAGSLLSYLSVGLLLEVFLFGLMRGCFPKLSIMLCMRAVHAFVHRLLAVGAWFPCFFGWQVVSPDQCIGDPYFLAGLCWGACPPTLATCVLLWSRESVPLASVCTVLLVSSLYRKLVLLFLIYILLTFDKKKKIASSAGFQLVLQACLAPF